MDNSEKNTDPVFSDSVDVFGDCDSNRLEKNTHMPSSESSDSNSSSSEEDEPPPKRRCHSRSSDSCQEIDRRFDQLSQQLVSHINNLFCVNYAAMHPIASNSSVPVAVASTAVNNSLDDPFLKPVGELKDIAELNVAVKEPSMPKANPDRVAKIASMQRFDSLDWNSVRYTEVQKKYVAFPAFSELKVNEELRRLEDPFAPLRWYQMERSFAALSNAFLAQNECVNIALKHLIDWAAKPDAQLTSDLIYDKLKELFGNDSNYKAVSHDILQLICGKRAEVLELRRKALLKGLKGKYIREDIDRIPPSIEYMFNPQSLSAYIQKIGGLDKLDKDMGPQLKPVRHSKLPVTSKSPIASTSRGDPSFRFQQVKPKQRKTKKQNLDEKVKKGRGGQKDEANRSRHK